VEVLTNTPGAPRFRAEALRLLNAALLSRRSAVGNQPRTRRTATGRCWWWAPTPWSWGERQAVSWEPQLPRTRSVSPPAVAGLTCRRLCRFAGSPAAPSRTSRAVCSSSTLQGGSRVHEKQEGKAMIFCYLCWSGASGAQVAFVAITCMVGVKRFTQ